MAKIDSELKVVDSAPIFQLTVAEASTSGSDLKGIVSFELFTSPPSLFSLLKLIRTANKAPLTNALMKSGGIDGPVTFSTSQRVLNGVWLVHKILFTAKSTHSEVAGYYADYIK